MLRRTKIRNIKRKPTLHGNTKHSPKVVSKRKKALKVRKNRLVKRTSGLSRVFLFASFGEYTSTDSRTTSSPYSNGRGTTRLPADNEMNETGNIVFGKYSKRKGTSGWGTGVYHPAGNPEGMLNTDYGWNIGNYGNTPSNYTGPKIGGSYLNIGQGSQSPYSGYAYTESSNPGSSTTGKEHSLRLPQINIDFLKYENCVLEFSSIFFQKNTYNKDWNLKIQYCTDKDFSGTIYDMDVTWGADTSFKTLSHDFNAKAYSIGGDNKIFDSSNLSWAGDWVKCIVNIPSKGTVYNSSNGLPVVIDFTQPFYLRFHAEAKYFTQDWAIDTVKVYGFTK